jgi:hypothetical protein
MQEGAMVNAAWLSIRPVGEKRHHVVTGNF